MIKFINNVKDSIYNPVFYKELETKPISFSIKYLLKLALVFTIVGIIAGFFIYAPRVSDALNAIPSSISDWYPDDLVLTIEKGEFSINKPEPYFIAFPEEADIEKENIQFSNIVVIDTKTPFSIEKYESYDSALWIMKDSVAFLSGAQIRVVRVVPLKGEETNAVIDKDFVNLKMSMAMNVIQKLPKIGLPILGAFVGFFWVIVKAIYLFIAALFVWIVFVIFNYKSNYGYSYKTALHAMTLPLLFFGLLRAFAIWSQPILVFSALLLVVALINISGIKKSTDSISDSSEHSQA